MTARLTDRTARFNSRPLSAEGAFAHGCQTSLYDFACILTTLPRIQVDARLNVIARRAGLAGHVLRGSMSKESQKLSRSC